MPLYVKELTKAMVEPGAARGVETIPATLADSLMARLDRLSAAKKAAQRAAVLGREFGYPLLAATAGLGDAALRHGLAHLVDAEILFARGEPPAATYTFKHALIQETAYHSLLKRTRQQLHARIAQVLEERFPERIASEPEVIARHYEAAGLLEEAVTHYQCAGERAQERSAHEEAIGHLRRAVTVLEILLESTKREAQEAHLQLALGASLAAVRGYSHAETEVAYERARALCATTGDVAQLAWALSGLASVYSTRGELDRAIALAEQALEIAEEKRDDALLLVSHVQVANPWYYQGKFAASLANFERVIALSDVAQDRAIPQHGGPDPRVSARAGAARNRWHLGYPDQALTRAREAVAVARRLEHPFSLAHALFYETVLLWARGDAGAQRERAAELIALSEAQGFPLWLGLGRAFDGAARTALGVAAATVGEVADGLATAAGTGFQYGAPALLALLAEVHAAARQHPEALAALERALVAAARTGQHFWDAELHRLKGELLLAPETDGDADAERLFRRTLGIARAQEARTLELRAATSLARMLRAQGKPTEARAVLASIYGWFTEGFDTRDLREAKALLEELR